MNYIIELLIKLKTEDVTAVTARRTLTQDMGYEGVLENLFREEYWRIEVEAKNSEGAENLGRELAEKRKLFVNPNKHTYKMAVSKESLAEERQDSIVRKKEEQTKQGLSEVRVLVNYREDEGAILTEETLRNTLGYGDIIKGVRRGTLWALLLKTDKKKAGELAQEIILSKNMDKGLLVNPHSQSYEIL
jgi:phosphoribosylformylglycinamidine (FGAM) synthase PurS component